MPDSLTASPAALIAAHGGRVTRTRVAVVEALGDSDHPLTHEELVAALTRVGVAHDRVTLYRALDWLVGHGIAHRVAGSDRAWRYGLMRQATHQHAHFHCDRCGHVFCLENLQPAFALALPGGYRLERAELILHGACPACQDTPGTDSPRQPPG
jgi:Fur family transcriptional regulator, ferric uptake regulator